MKYFCCSERRRNQVLGHPTLNGISFLEVAGDPKSPVLEVYFINSLVAEVASTSISIDGGERIKNVPVKDASLVNPTQLQIIVEYPGDFSTYTLRINPTASDALVLDPLLSSVEFSFNIHVASEFDCEAEIAKVQEPQDQPTINYLAKDFSSLRTLMLDRISTLIPDWQERNAADLNMALVEVLAYVGDYLSYRQDAIATEAYLGTARRRTSVRRHARLVDYRMHNGCNARAWVQIQVSAHHVFLEQGTPLLTRVNEDAPQFAPGSVAFKQAISQEPEHFETMHDAHLFSEHNGLPFYTWGEIDCCLPTGATQATLQGHRTNLKAGDILILTEERGTQSGDPADALPGRRHAVRLKHVFLSEDPLGGRFLPVPNNDPVQVTEIIWMEEDALPFSLCLSKTFTPRIWGLTRDSLIPKGAFSATLQGHLRYLAPGDLLSLTTVDSGTATTHDIQLTNVSFASVQAPDPSAPKGRADVSVTEIVWDAKNALPFAAEIGKTEISIGYFLSIARGNIVLVDHGRTIIEVIQEEVPEPQLFRIPESGGAHCDVKLEEAIPPRFNPTLLEKQITYAVQYIQKPAFQISPKSEHIISLDNHTFTKVLQAEFSAQGIGFGDNVSVQGTSNEWSVSDDNKAYRIYYSEADNLLNMVKVKDAASRMREIAPADTLPNVSMVSTHHPLTEAERIVEFIRGRQGERRQERLASIEQTLEGQLWSPQHDLLNSGSQAREFVVETESNGSASIRFGDDRFGRKPESGARFIAIYRIGNGASGNVGANTITHIVTNEKEIERVFNPFPASGGVESESIDSVRQKAPFAFRRQERAVTLKDYAERANEHPEVQKAVATRRWTGSWHTIFLAVDRISGLPVNKDFEDDVRRHLEKYRMAGHDIEVESPRFVSVEIDLVVWIEPGYFRLNVKQALLRRFSNDWTSDGQRGLFHPDNLTFGQSIYQSHIYAAAEEIHGVTAVEITKFQRQGIDDDTALDSGKLEIGRMEIARLENNPNFPERGILRLTLKGGK